MLPKKISAIIKLSVVCNYNCEFCYYTHHKPERNALMPFQLFEKILRMIIDYNLSNGVHHVHYVLHGGEPLLVGLDYLKDIIALEKRLENEFDGISFSHSIQTNSYLMTDDIMHFLVDNDFQIGISLDGDQSKNYHYGKDGVEKCTKVVLNNIKKLQSLGAHTGILSVITERNAEYAKEYYDFLVENGIHNVGFCPCVNDEIDATISTEALIKFYKEFFDLYFYGNYKLRIREFEAIMCNYLGKKAVCICTSNCRNSCGSFISIDTEGNVFFCDNAYEPENAVGNIYEGDFKKIFESSKYQAEVSNSRRIIAEKCSKCEIFSICHGGCYRNDIIKDGIMSNHFCEVYKGFYPYIKQVVDLNLNT